MAGPLITRQMQRQKRRQNRNQIQCQTASANPGQRVPDCLTRVTLSVSNLSIVDLLAYIHLNIFPCRKCCNFEPKRSHVQSFFIANLPLSTALTTLSGCCESLSCGEVLPRPLAAYHLPPPFATAQRGVKLPGLLPQFQRHSAPLTFCQFQ